MNAQFKKDTVFFLFFLYLKKDTANKLRDNLSSQNKEGLIKQF